VKLRARFLKHLPVKYRKTTKLTKRLLAACDQTIQSGPFVGMSYLAQSVGSVAVPKLLGTYELELHHIIERIIAARPNLILNVGAAEGYYSVGLARRLPDARIYSWELSQKGQELCSQLIQSNALTTGKITQYGFCGLSDLISVASQHATLKAVVICDIEGGEAMLLDPAIIPSLRCMELLVEVHEFAVAGVGRILQKRFESSHDIETLHARHRTFSDWPLPEDVLGLLPARLRGTATALMNEHRPPGMYWFYMRPRN
jgi:hypothetical protein